MCCDDHNTSKRFVICALKDHDIFVVRRKDEEAIYVHSCVHTRIVYWSG